MKIWTLNKILVCQVNLQESCESAIFGNHLGDVIIAHESKLSLICEKYLQISDQELREVKIRFKKNFPQIQYFGKLMMEKAANE